MGRTRLEKLTKTQIQQRGWTESLMKKYIKVEPELLPNPMFKGASPMKLWEESYILSIEATDDFKKDFELAQKRKQAAKERCERLPQKNIEELKPHLSSIQVKRVKNVERKAISSKYDWFSMTKKDFFESRQTFTPDSDVTLKRWTVNYIRHNLTSYDNFLENIFNRVGVSEMYGIVRDTVFDKMLEVYPEYGDEILRQKNYE